MPNGPDHEPEPWGEDVPGSRHLDVDTLSAYLDQQLPPAELTAIRAHLATCPECGRELAELRATVALLRELPQYAPRRSFQLGPEHARGAVRRGIGITGWFERLVPALPALRIATVAVAVLLVAVIAGDLVTNRGAAPAPMVQTGDQATERASAPESEPAPAPAVQAPAPAAEAPESEGVMPRMTDVQATEVIAEAYGGQPAAEGGTEPEAPASMGEEDSAEDAPGVISSEPAAEPAEPAPRSAVPGWRLAQVGLGLALVWLIVSLAGVAWLRRDRS
jgi:hypothetical protein